MRSARNLYRLTAALAGAGVVAVLATTALAVGRIDPSPVAAQRVLSYCRRLLAPELRPAALAVLALVLLGLTVWARGIRAARRWWRGSRRALRARPVVAELTLDGVGVRLIDDPRPVAFCAGLLRPRIYLSSGASELLSRAELRAVLAHEAHHARRRDPLRMLALAVLADALFFLPALRSLSRRYAELAELAADEAALARTGDRPAVAAALLRFGDRGPAGVVGITPERVDHLLGWPPHWRLPRVPTVATLLGLVALLFLAATIARAHGAASSAALAAQACMVCMAALPLVSAAGLAWLGRLALHARRA